ncbi:type II secretion system GspH family protein [Patescibacteria group bacterium]|nr:type II secretion system GspH family protein [Patescibacteria group bacterium]
MKKSVRGFTLIEVMVVVAVIGLLSSVILASLAYAGQRGRDAKRVQDMKQLQSALELYASDNGGKYPLVPTSFVWELGSSLAPKYIPQLPEDPTRTGGNRYRYYTVNGTNASSYSMVVNLESDDPDVGWCLVKLGIGYSAWDQYPPCDL